MVDGMIMSLTPFEAAVVEVALRTVAHDFWEDSQRTREDKEFLMPHLEAAEGLLNKYFGGAEERRYHLPHPEGTECP
jgi:hypothetical protein